MENIEELIMQVFYLSLFLLALFFFNSNVKVLDTLEQQGKENIYSGIKVMYEQNQEDKQQTTISYRELCCMLMKPLAYNVKIDNLILKKESFDYMDFDLSVLKKTEYKRKYIYDSLGNIESVVYENMGEQ